MTLVGTGAPRVVVRPPNVPAPPLISLLTQNNVVEDDRDVLGAGQGNRWIAGGGVQWFDPTVEGATTWQKWPSEGGEDAQTKNLIDPITNARQSPIQLPMIAAAQLDSGVLAEFALRTGTEGSPVDQAVAAFNALLPGLIEDELWTGVQAARALWADQFRLMSAGHVDTATGSTQPFLRGLALAEQIAASAGFIGELGGAMIHASPQAFSLITAKHNGLTRAATGRQWLTPSGCALVTGPGATGTWSDANDDVIIESTPAIEGDQLTTGWLFVTPPVRVRLGVGGVDVIVGEWDEENDRRYVVERAFTIEAAVKDTPTSIGIPIDYTQEF